MRHWKRFVLVGAVIVCLTALVVISEHNAYATPPGNKSPESLPFHTTVEFTIPAGSLGFGDQIIAPAGNRFVIRHVSGFISDETDTTPRPVDVQVQTSVNGDFVAHHIPAGAPFLNSSGSGQSYVFSQPIYIYADTAALNLISVFRHHGVDTADVKVSLSGELVPLSP